MKAIVVATTRGREHWLKDCLESIESKHPVLVVDHYDYELGKIRWVYENTTLDEFLLLQDSVVIKDPKWLDEIFDIEGSVSLSTKPYFMFLGKYVRTDLDKVDIPVVNTKLEAITFEDSWTYKYKEAANKMTYLWPLLDTAVFMEHHGRENMILENDHLIKYKGCWNPSMV